MSEKTWEEAAAVEMERVNRTPHFLASMLDEVDHYLDAIKTVLLSENGWGNIEDYFRYIADASICGFMEASQVNHSRGQVKQIVLDTIATKQHDYGHENIMWAGLDGVVVRMHDKRARLRNLLRRGGANNESVLDTWLDLVGYSIIALMLINSTFTCRLGEDIMEGPVTVDVEVLDGEDPPPAENTLLTEPEPEWSEETIADAREFERYEDLMKGFQRLILVGQYKFGWSADCTIDIQPWGRQQPQPEAQEAPSE
jgi:hypothetical protein